MEGSARAINFTVDMASPNKVLLLASDPVGSGIRLDREVRAVSRAINEGRNGESFKLIAEFAVTVSDLPRLISLHQPEIVHFAGHGTPDGILLEDEQGGVQAVGSETLRRLLSTVGKSIRVVVLNAGETLQTAEALSSTVDYTIGYAGPITDAAAVAFTDDFYVTLTAGKTVREAFDLAAHRVLLESGTISSTPHLLVRSPISEVSGDADSSRREHSAMYSDLAEGSRSAVFVSYSHKDRRWLERLQIHLRPLERDHSIDVWDDTKIRPGTPWKSEIEKAISNAKVAILLVSADFLASDFVAKNELPPLLRAAEEEGAMILPIIVSPCRFVRTPLGVFQAVNDPEKPLNSLKGANRERILTRVADVVESAFLKP